MADLNSFNGTGRLGKDVEMREVGEYKVVSFSIAISGSKKDDVTWLTCVAWNKQAEFMSRYACKGSHLRVSGRIQVRQHNDKYYTEIVANEYDGVQILAGWKDQGDQPGGQNNQRSQHQQGTGGDQRQQNNPQGGVCTDQPGCMCPECEIPY